LEPETLSCPFCGAIYREVIPSGTVQVKCKYCGGAIVVPAYLSGEVRRCSNHPDVLAVGLCNDCGGDFCGACLNYYDIEHGTLHLCPRCYTDREAKRALGAVVSGFIVLFFGLLMLLVGSGSGGGVLVAVFFGAIGLAFIAYGLAKRSPVLEGLAMRRSRDAFERNVEFRESFGPEVPTIEIYNRLLVDSLRNYGPKLAIDILERELDFYEQMGLTRGEAVRKLAGDRGY